MTPRNVMLHTPELHEAMERFPRRSPGDVSAEWTGVSMEDVTMGTRERNAVRNEKAAPAPSTTIQSVNRALDILEVLAGAEVPMRLQDIAQNVGLKVPTCHHLVNSLVARNFVGRIHQPRAYVLGSKLAHLARESRGRFNYIRALEPQLDALATRTGCAVVVATLSGTTLTTASMIQAPAGPNLADWRERLSEAAHATAVGKAILAWLPELEVAKVVAEHDLTAFTPKSICSLGDLVENLRQVRRHGFAVEDGETQQSVSGIACVLRDASGGVIGAIGVLLDSAMATNERLAELQRELAVSTRDLVQMIGEV